MGGGAVTGPEHFREAERLLVQANRRLGPNDREYAHCRDDRAELRAEAQVHATLALAAATALGREGEGRTQPSKDRAAWFAAAAECKKGE